MVKTELSRLVNGPYNFVTYFEDKKIIMEIMKEGKLLQRAKMGYCSITIETAASSSTHRLNRKVIYTSITTCTPPEEFRKIEGLTHLSITLSEKPPGGPKVPSGLETPICAFMVVCSREFSNCLQSVVNLGMMVEEAAASVIKQKRI